MISAKWTGTQNNFGIMIAVAIVLSFASMAQARPWAEHSTKLSSLSRQIESGEHEIHELIQHKKHANDPTEIKALVEQIATRHKALEKSEKDYEEERRHVRFEHPEKNDVLERKYKRHEFKTLEELEHDFGIQGRLDRIRTRVFATFPIPPRPPKPERPKPIVRIPASQRLDAAEEEFEKVHLSK